MIAQLAISQLNIVPPLAQPEGNDRPVNGMKPALKKADSPEKHNPEKQDPERYDLERYNPERPEIEGLVQVITAKHRSFFTQTLAQALRSAGQGTLVLVVQFLKGGIQQGTKHPVQLGQCLDWYRCNLETCIDPYRPETLTAEVRHRVQELWQHTRNLVLENRYELVILDEISLTLKLGLIQEYEVVDLLEQRPARVEIVLTGPEMPKPLLSLADQVTELRRSPRI